MDRVAVLHSRPDRVSANEHEEEKVTDDVLDREVPVEVDPDDAHPIGAFVLTMAFLVLIAAVWIYSYSILIGRG